MPVRRGHVAPRTTLIETIIRKFDTHDRSFVVANAQHNSCHVIYCSDGFCRLTGYSRAEVMQRSAVCDFLHGPLTSQSAVQVVKQALAAGNEKHFEILYYRKDDRNSFLRGKMSQKIIVTVKEGKIRGFKTRSEYSGTEFYSFLGVPYGQSTAGEARYKDPVRVKPWKNVLDATSEKTGCIQFSFRKNLIAGDEECLYNNIHTTKIPSNNEKQLKAVVVNIHPGGFGHGSPDPDYYGSAEYIMNHDIVYVCVGYRLHILGHLNLNLKNNCSGNQSIKDIILSLKWMKENIQAFGGDPENITLLGSSSGSAIVHTLLLSPLAKGLFHKAIPMGMYIFNPTLTTYNEHVALAYELASNMDYSGKMDDKRKLLNFYKKIDFYSFLLLFRFQKGNGMKNILVFPTSPFIPLCEPGENSPVPAPFPELIPSTHRIPIMVGFCNREGIMGIALLNKMKRSLSQCFDKSLTQNVWAWGANLKDDELKLIQKEVEDYYLDGKCMDTASESDKCDILTDISLSDVYDTLINVVSSDPTSPVYVYHFEYDGGLPSMREQNQNNLETRVDGAFHAADYSYWCCLTNRLNKSPSQVTPRDRKMIETMTNLITTFAKTGNPNNDHIPVNWKSSTPENPCYLNINETLEVKDELLRGERMQFWHDLKKRFKPHNE